ncbi:cAMP-dependent protein kinase [Sarracenia purpurea var. burkii]
MPHPYKNSIEEAEMSQPVRSRGGSVTTCKSKEGTYTCREEERMEKSEGTVQMDFLVGSIAVTAVYVAPPMELMIENNKRITIAEVIDNEWFKKGYKPPSFEQADVSLDDVDAIFNESGDSTNLVVERREERPANPVSMNAFELISKSQGLNLSSLFEKQMGLVKRETRFTSKCPAREVISKIEEAAVPLGFDVKKNNCKRRPLLLCLSVAPSSI